jgi:hypothetical protein
MPVHTPLSLRFLLAQLHAIKKIGRKIKDREGKDSGAAGACLFVLHDHESEAKEQPI